MWDLTINKLLNEQAVAEHDLSLLNEKWLEGEAQLVRTGAAAPPSPPSSGLSKRTIFPTPEATISFAEFVLGVELTALRRAMKDLIEAERGEASEPDTLAVYMFVLALEPELLSSWTEALRAKVQRYEHIPASSFNIVVQGKARILIRHNCVVGVAPIRRHKRMR